jgi:hypothetical protein
MRATIDIPDETYRQVKVFAAEHGTTVRQLVLDGLSIVARPAPKPVRKFVVPVIQSSRPGTLDLTNEQIDDILFSS